METYIKKYTEIGIKDMEEVGYKNASIGKMMHHLIPNGVPIPKGFAITAKAYRYFIAYNNLELPLKFLMAALDKKDFSNLAELSGQARKMIMDGRMPGDLGMTIIDAYDDLFDLNETEVAVRSSMVYGQVADAFAAGLNDSFLNVKGHGALLYAVRQCFASLYTDRAVRHAAEKDYEINLTAMAVGIQEMVRADKGCSGVAFTHDPRTNSEDMICLQATWGLGEMINHGCIEPDEYMVFKPSVKTLSVLVVEKKLGAKNKMMVYADEADETNQTVINNTPPVLQQSYVLNEKKIQRLAEWAILLEEIYQKPMCFEWAKDGNNGQLYLIQLSPMAAFNHPEDSLLVTDANQRS
jgi:pyruvate,water dikinase